jgi:hypothetical protein
MSDIGLYAGWYDRVRRLAQLIDGALLELQGSSATGNAASTLSKLLTVPDSSASLSREILLMVLRERHHEVNLARLGNELSHQETAHEAVRELEVLAEILERERANTVEQMRK